VQIALNLPTPLPTAPGAAATGATPLEQAVPGAVATGAPPEKAAPARAGARPQPPLTTAAPPPAAPTHLYLVIRNLQVRAQTGVLYAVYLNVGTGAAKKSSRLGTINFFDAGMASMMSQKFASFDVTGSVDGNVSTKEIAVTIAAVGEPATDAKPVIGDITLASG
jgi:hypothetical protein